MEVDVLGVGVGNIGGNRRCRNFLLRIKTLAFCVDEIVSVWANACNDAIHVLVVHTIFELDRGHLCGTGCFSTVAMLWST